jgi:hypothetical protein
MSITAIADHDPVLNSQNTTFSATEDLLIQKIKSSPSIFSSFNKLLDHEIVHLLQAGTDGEIPVPFHQMGAFYVLAITNFTLRRFVPLDMLTNQEIVLQAVQLNPTHFLPITDRLYQAKNFAEQIAFTDLLINSPALTEQQKAPILNKKSQLIEENLRTQWEVVDTPLDLDIDIGEITL